MKVLFLDIDGVVNCRLTPQTDGWPIDPYMALLVGRIVIATDCKIILSSSWRHSQEGIDIVSKKVMPVFDKTTTENFGTVSRGTEIKEWLQAHPEVTHYAILDDNNDMYKDQMSHFFHTSFQTGLTEEMANKVIEHLLNPLTS